MNISSYDFSYDEMSVISKKQFDVHMKLYKDYINKINEITQDLNNSSGRKEANATYSKYRGLKKGETYALDGVILHELYFQNMGPKCEIPNKTQIILEKHFGSINKFKEDFVACAKASRGWCVLVYEQRTQSLRCISQDLHNEGVITSAYPIIVLDMYEHAYYIDYADKKDEYIENFFDAINWDIVDNRIARI